MLFAEPNKLRRTGGRPYKKKFIYSTKAYSNPFFNRRRGHISRGQGFKIRLIFIASVATIIVLIWLIFFSTLFKINQIEVSGAGDEMTQEVKNLAWGVAGDRLLGKNNLLLYNKDDLAKQLNDKYYLENLKIEKVFFHTLKINLTEQRQTAVWREDDKYYYLDGEGNVINQADPLSLNRLSLPLIENLTEIKIDGRKANVDKATINYTLELFNEFKDGRHGFDIEKFILDKEINTIKMAVLEGPQIYFNTKETVASQTASLDIIIKEKLKDNFKKKEYINLKYGSNVYIK